MDVQQELHRHKLITKSMGDELVAGFAKEKKAWKHKYETDVTFYKEEYHLFKGFVEDILLYLKANGLYSSWSQQSGGQSKHVLSLNHG